MKTVRIGILGDFNPGFESHHATNAALRLAAESCGLGIDACWVPTPSLNSPSAEATLESYDAVFASPGSPYASFDGMLAAIGIARRRNHVFIGTCGGFQYTLLEFARNVAGIADADTREEGSKSRNFVIAPVVCPVAERPTGAPKLSGRLPVRIASGSRLASIYGVGEAQEGYFCNFEVNREYQAALETAGLRPAAFGPQGEWRAIELPDRRFFVATLFQPQLTSVETGEPHPVLVEYVRQAAGQAHLEAVHAAGSALAG
jgi:CTP synthase (UTP-ammonia lyase)